MKREYFSDVKEGRLQRNISKQIAADLLSFDGKRIHLTIDRAHLRRTIPQNAIFHLYVGIIAKEVGFDPEDMKEAIKYKFLKREKADELTGELMTFIAPTSSLSKAEFIELIERTIRWSGEFFGLVLPDPRDYGLK